MRKYDTTFIIDGNLQEAAREAIIEKFSGILQKLGAEIDQTVRWGQRTLAYEMKKCNHGYYVIFYYRAEPTMIASFERDLRLHESILRYMTLIYEGKHPDYIRDEGAVGESASSQVSKKDTDEDFEEPDLTDVDEETDDYLDEEIDMNLPENEEIETDQEKEKE
ncbi:MAG: 30S ribosomal protein S6 [Candidatus Latescibacterota bacterium]